MNRLFRRHGLRICHVEELPTHGGSLRIYAVHEGNVSVPTQHAVSSLLKIEEVSGLNSVESFRGFQQRVDVIKNEFLTFLLEQRRDGKTVVGYGAAAKGNTLLNYCGVRQDLLSYVVDRSSYKQGQYLPGSRIPIVREERLREDKPDYVVILPWNLRDEIMSQLAYARDWGCRFVTAIPRTKVE